MEGRNQRNLLRSRPGHLHHIFGVSNYGSLNVGNEIFWNATAGRPVLPNLDRMRVRGHYLCIPLSSASRPTSLCLGLQNHL